MPLISVLTAAIGRRARFVAEAGESIAAQRLPRGWTLEWVVQEDGVEPSLADVVGRFPFARHAAHDEQLGVAMTRNLALTRVRGPLVHVLDCDDLLLPDALATAIAAFAAHPRIHWVAGQADDLLPDATRVAVGSLAPDGLVAPGVISGLVVDHERSPVHPAGMTMRTATVRALGGWSANPRSEDNALLAAIAELSWGWFTPEVTWLYRRHDEQTTGQAHWPALDPISWELVRQRIAAVRETGLYLRAPGEIAEAERMDARVWRSVDEYWNEKLLAPDPALDAALEANRAAELPAIDVSSAQGKLLHLLARSIGATNILEVGTLGGYSTIWLARALPPEGRLVTCEIDPRHAEIASANLARAGVDALVDVRVGKALDTLAGLEGPFDLTFVDADKAATTEYFEEAVRLTRSGGMIIIDNVVRGGGVVDPDAADPAVSGIRRFADAIAGDTRVEATAIQTVGAKSYDGFVLAIVT